MELNMPQIGKGGKFVFGWSVINDDYSVKLPDMAVKEYGITSDGKVIITSGSKTTGGFCVSNKRLISNSKIKVLFDENPLLDEYKTKEREFIRYKGRLFCWLGITKDGTIKLNDKMLDIFSLKVGDRLLSIRGSCIGVTMGAKGPLIEMANEYKGEIEVF
jgi:hypothetical protein